MSRIDVIIPCYNYAHLLSHCVESVVSQAGVEVRVLIIDDASPDSTPEVAAQLIARYSCIEYRRHSVNQRHISTYNEGLEWATGDYTVLLSADDLLVPGALLRASRVLDAHPEIGFVYGRHLRFESHNALPSPSTVAGTCSWMHQTGRQWLEAICGEGDNLIASPEVVVRTPLQKKLGGYRPDLPHSGDMEMWMRFAAHADVGILDADQAYYRVHGQNMHVQQFGAVLDGLNQCKAAYDRIFEEQADFIPQKEQLQDLAHRSLARNALWKACEAFDKGETAQVPIEDLVNFAVQTYAKAASMREYASLRKRKFLGSRLWFLFKGMAQQDETTLSSAKPG